MAAARPVSCAAAPVAVPTLSPEGPSLSSGLRSGSQLGSELRHRSDRRQCLHQRRRRSATPGSYRVPLKRVLWSVIGASVPRRPNVGHRPHAPSRLASARGAYQDKPETADSVVHHGHARRPLPPLSM